MVDKSMFLLLKLLNKKCSYKYKLTSSNKAIFLFTANISATDERKLIRGTPYLVHFSKKWLVSSGTQQQSHQSVGVSIKSYIFYERT